MYYLDLDGAAPLRIASSLQVIHDIAAKNSPTVTSSQCNVYRPSEETLFPILSGQHTQEENPETRNFTVYVPGDQFSLD